MCSNLVKCMIFERNKELMWLKINNKSLKKICVCETNISFLRLRPRLFVDGIKVWDWDFSLWSQIWELVSRIETDTETLKRWSQGLRLRLRSAKSQSKSRDQRLAQLCNRWWLCETMVLNKWGWLLQKNVIYFRFNMNVVISQPLNLILADDAANIL